MVKKPAHHRRAVKRCRVDSGWYRLFDGTVTSLDIWIVRFAHFRLRRWGASHPLSLSKSWIHLAVVLGADNDWFVVVVIGVVLRGFIGGINTYTTVILIKTAQSLGITGFIKVLTSISFTESW